MGETLTLTLIRCFLRNLTNALIHLGVLLMYFHISTRHMRFFKKHMLPDGMKFLAYCCYACHTAASICAEPTSPGSWFGVPILLFFALTDTWQVVEKHVNGLP